MKVYYLNDEPHEITVRILDTRFDPYTGKGDIYVNLQPAEGRLFEVYLPEDSVLWVKKWVRAVMISYTYPTDHSQSAAEQPRSGAV